MYRILICLIIATSLQAVSLRDKAGELKQRAKDFVELCGEKVDESVDALVDKLKHNWLQEGFERWDMKGKREELLEKAYPILVDIGCIDSIHASEMEYDYALVLGANSKAMRVRLDFLYEEWQRGVRFSEIVLLTGERDIDHSKEKCPEDIYTEAELMVHLFENHPLAEVAPCVLIDVPKVRRENGSYERPRTIDTILAWLDTNPEAGKCLAVSTQPFVGYQGAVVHSQLPKEFESECIGPGVDSVYESLQEYNVMGICLDTFARWLAFERLGDFK